MLLFIVIRRKYLGSEGQGEFPLLILGKYIWSLSPFFCNVQVYEKSQNQIHQNSITYIGDKKHAFNSSGIS